jgi:hypothetical protein
LPAANRFHRQPVDRGEPKQFQQRAARAIFVDPERAPEFAVHETDPAEVIHHDDSIEHRTEDALHALFAFAHAFLKLAAALRQFLKGESHPAHVRIAADQKPAGRTMFDNVVR